MLCSLSCAIRYGTHLGMHFGQCTYLMAHCIVCLLGRSREMQRAKYKIYSANLKERGEGGCWLVVNVGG